MGKNSGGTWSRQSRGGSNGQKDKQKAVDYIGTRRGRNFFREGERGGGGWLSYATKRLVDDCSEKEKDDVPAKKQRGLRNSVSSPSKSTYW